MGFNTESSPAAAVHVPQPIETKIPNRDVSKATHNTVPEFKINLDDEFEIKMIMEHAACSKSWAIEALKKNNGDTVKAILQLTYE